MNEMRARIEARMSELPPSAGVSDYAQAALEALRTPTDEMLAAAQQVEVDTDGSISVWLTEVEIIHKRMIDSVLGS